MVDPNVISELTGLPLTSGLNQHLLLSFEDYKLIMVLVVQDCRVVVLMEIRCIIMYLPLVDG